jgi:hypothetical protein
MIVACKSVPIGHCQGFFAVVAAFDLANISSSGYDVCAFGRFNAAILTQDPGTGSHQAHDAKLDRVRSGDALGHAWVWIVTRGPQPQAGLCEFGAQEGLSH